MKIAIDQESCIASGTCTALCPEVFGQDDEGYVLLLDDEPGPELREKIEDAIDSCPAACISADD